MKIITEDRDIKAIISSELAEINLGPWEGKTKEETKETHPNEYNNFWNEPHLFALEGAESYEHLQKRIVSKIKLIFAENDDKNILVVTHWIAIKVAHAYFSAIPISNLSTLPDIENGGFLTLENDNGNNSISEL